MKATTLLRNDHSAVKKLFRAYEKAEKADDNEKKTSVFDEIARELHIHAKVALLAQPEKMKPEDETYDAKVTVLIEWVEHHAGEEESEMFPDAEKTLDDARLWDVGARIERRKAELAASFSGKASARKRLVR
jgi:hypothetical protein